MKIKFHLAGAVVVLSLLACSLPWTKENDGTAAQSGLNLLVAAEGEIQLKRSSWSDFARTALGAVIYPGDQLRPASGAKVVVLCQSLTEWIVPSGAPVGIANGCPATEPTVLKRGVSQIGHTRAGDNPLIPYIISPRQTKILAAQPVISWNPVSDASTYTVQVIGEKVIWEESGITANQVIYNGPTLQEKKTYRVVVTSDTGESSEDENAGGLGFSLLENKDAKAVLAAETRITGLALSDEARALALAQLYQGYGLLSEAALALEVLAMKESQTPAIYRLLADFYLQTGLNLMAEDRYDRALDLYAQAGDPEGQAEAQMGLAQVNLALGRNEETRRNLTSAQAFFEQLGDQSRLQVITDLLKTIP
jgi:hypothetical protein